MVTVFATAVCTKWQKLNKHGQYLQFHHSDEVSTLRLNSERHKVSFPVENIGQPRVHAILRVQGNAVTVPEEMQTDNMLAF